MTDLPEPVDVVRHDVHMPGVESATAHSRGSTTADAVIRAAVRVVDEDGVDARLMFLLGSVLWEVPRRETERERLIATADRAEGAAQMRADRDTLGRRDRTDYFDFGTHVILDGLALKAAARCTRRSGR